MAKTAQLVARVDPELMEAFRKAALADDRSIASAIQAAMRAWLAAHTPTKDTSP